MSVAWTATLQALCRYMSELYPRKAKIVSGTFGKIRLNLALCLFRSREETRKNESKVKKRKDRERESEREKRERNRGKRENGNCKRETVGGWRERWTGRKQMWFARTGNLQLEEYGLACKPHWNSRRARNCSGVELWASCCNLLFSLQPLASSFPSLFMPSSSSCLRLVAI